MATPTDALLTGDLSHLSIDDLFESLPSKPRLGGQGPFVINLSASAAPISLPKGPIGGDRTHVYQIQRVEDHRLRYRLRLGPFAGEDEADAVLRQVRDVYPRALTATADADDQRALSQIEAKTGWMKPAGVPVKPSPHPEKPAVAYPTVHAAVGNAIAAAAKPAETVRPAATTPTLSAGAPALPRIPVISHVVEGRPKPSSPPQTSAAQPKLVARARVSEVETTRTVRALTAAELNDENSMRSFVIELARSGEPFDPQAVPHLDIFSAYKLYSVASIDHGAIVHSLRLGFFGEELAAVAVSSYLAAFYDKPRIQRVSLAERQRFADHRLEARKDVGATGKHASIEITNERYVRDKRPAQGQT